MRGMTLGSVEKVRARNVARALFQTGWFFIGKSISGATEAIGLPFPPGGNWPGYAAQPRMILVGVIPATIASFSLVEATKARFYRDEARR